MCVYTKPKGLLDGEGQAGVVEGLHQEDPRLVELVRESPPLLPPYNLTHPGKKHYSEFGQSNILDEFILHGLSNGVYLEAGAVDGEYLSNTLYLEKHLGWSGVLVEPLPATYDALRRKHRKSYTLNAALSTTTTAQTLHMRTEGKKGVMSHFLREGEEEGEGEGEVTVLSLPLYTILLSLNLTQLDFLSLDLEGAELKVLRTVPWERVRVRVLCVECNRVGASPLTHFLLSQGYYHIGNFGIDCWYGWPSLLSQTFP
ncbi:hypothetical protein O3P69_019272 [Scylla paramamosain]|uniref:Methyltransferase FkbM domain-containing protein n=1 Tax=Scylla paramamosain TaxID=85552 RepID=A0AAW0SVI0_SCYPA